MSGTITVGDKILASHDNVSGKLSMSENVDMSNMVFPAGHILQVKNRGYYGYSASKSFSVTGATQQLVGGLSISFVPMKENSNFIIEMSGPLMTGGVARGSSLLYVKNSQTRLVRFI